MAVDASVEERLVAVAFLEVIDDLLHLLCVLPVGNEHCV